MQLSAEYASTLSETVSAVTPQPLNNMQLRHYNTALAAQFKLPTSFTSDALLEILFAKDSAIAQQSVAQKYGGHQFGQWNPYLGDGRGLLLGEASQSAGVPYDLHLKGAGQTPYSRHADGRAVLRSTIREYIGSEALHHLHIPSSRALCLISSDELIMREEPESAAMMIRMAPSHIRFGHFEYYYHSGQTETLQRLFDFTLTRYFPECLQHDNPHQALLTAITLRTARMIAYWQVFGFVHGVMNTDNMSIHGVTFDYGPYAFIEKFDNNGVFNHSDHEGRYAFDRQPGIGLWNLNALAYAFSDYVSADDIRLALRQFEPTFLRQYQRLMLTRIGLNDSEEHQQCLHHWIALLGENQADYTHTMRLLSQADASAANSVLRDHFIHRNKFDTWWQDYRARRLNSEVSQASINQLNPVLIPRTHYLQNVIDAAQKGDFSEMESLLAAVQQPFADNATTAPYQKPPANNSQVSLSCSS